MRLGQRAYYSDQKGNEDRSDRSISPDEITSRIENYNNERINDNHETERDNDRRRTRQTDQHLN